MASAEIIAIGTELLLGITPDTNTCYLANQLRALGIDLYRTTIIGDNEARITQLVQEALNRADIVITTGGLGPTVDDPTRSAIARVYDVPLDFHPELWDLIVQRFINFGRVATENNRRQAYLPRNAAVILNPVGTAPAFYIHQNHHLLISLPGVPKEMEYLFTHAVSQLILDTFPEHASIVTKVVHLIGIGESVVDQLIGDLEESANPTVGLSAKSGQIDIRITAKAASAEEAAALIQPALKSIQEKLHDHIFGMDDDTLLQTILDQLKENKNRLHLTLINHTHPELENQTESLQTTSVNTEISDPTELLNWIRKFPPIQAAMPIIFAVFQKSDRMELAILNASKPDEEPLIRTFLGPREDFPQWLKQNELGYLFSFLKRAI